MEAQAARSTSSHESSHVGASVGISYGFNTGLTTEGAGPSWGAGVSGSVSAGFSEGESEAMRHLRTQVTGRTVDLEVDGDAALIGAVVAGERVRAEIGGDLEVVTVADLASSRNRSLGGSLGLSMGLGGAAGYDPGEVDLGGGGDGPVSSGLGVSFGEGERDSAWIDRQAGFQGTDVAVEVEGHTRLEGGSIAGDLTTGSLSWSDLEGHDRGRQVDLSLDGSLPVTGGGGSGDGLLPDRVPTGEGGFASHEREQVARATVTGDVTVTDPDAQDQDLAALNRDPDRALEVTKDERTSFDVYVSPEALEILGELGGELATEIVGMIEEFEANKSPDQRAAEAAAQTLFESDPEILRQQVQGCGAAASCMIDINGDGQPDLERANLISDLAASHFRGYGKLNDDAQAFVAGLTEQLILETGDPKTVERVLEGLMFLAGQKALLPLAAVGGGAVLSKLTVSQFVAWSGALLGGTIVVAANSEQIVTGSLNVRDWALAQSDGNDQIGSPGSGPGNGNNTPDPDNGGPSFKDLAALGAETVLEHYGKDVLERLVEVGELSWTDANEVLAKTGEQLPNKLPTNNAQLKHIFRDAPGHLPDTPENQEIIKSLMNNQGNYVGPDQYGNSIYVSNQPDGRQVWAQVRDGVLQNGGVNDIPRRYIKDVGLVR